MSRVTNDYVVSISGEEVRPGQTRRISVPVAMLYTHTQVEMPVHVINGRRPGPRLFVSAAVHGDELNGIEIIRRLMANRSLRSLRGTLILVPVVNVFGVLNHSRYLPDRRDLNRSFPGSGKGSLAARLADLFMNEIVAQCDYGIDLHTGAIHRSNLPQIRANLDDEDTLCMAKEFGVPVLINADLRDGSLRAAAAEKGVKMLLYEAGEALRFDELSIRGGVSGVFNVMRALGMLPKPARAPRKRLTEPVIARSSKWVRAVQGGILRAHVKLGDRVSKGMLLGVVDSPLGGQEEEIRAQFPGIVIGRSSLPLVNEGDAVFHIARFGHTGEAMEAVEAFQESGGHSTDPSLINPAEPEII